ncbi:hypothetical protein [Novipirellula maiorica]|uniref:hypothetical protein n=1 Tax=Novipirellula maiorica TaxID=1265734 RepID=UPI0011819409|nr:hypothetical protein [Rhodopirellula maiorica]
MYTKFTTDLGDHVFDPGGMLSYSPKGPGKEFLGVLGGAYEEECDEDRATVIEAGTQLLSVLRDESLDFHIDAPQYADALETLLVFLANSKSETVTAYSWEDPATLEQLLACEAEGGGGDDWAMEVISERADEFLPGLEAVLADSGQAEFHFSAIRMLLFCYPRDQATPIVEAFVENTSDLEKRKGALLLLAATDPQNQK